MPPGYAKLKSCETGRFRLSYLLNIMDRTERFYRIDQLLNERRAVSMRTFIDELEVSRATCKRDLEYMRERLHAPIVWDRELRGYRFDPNEPAATSYALPGLWFNASEIHALLSMQQLLADVQPGLLEPHIEPLRSRIRLLLDGDDHSVEEVQRRIRVLRMAARSVVPRFFETVSSALLSRRRLQLVHYSRERDEETEREVSPQRLVHYRDNWYLDTWCHMRRGLRSFAVDGFRRATVSDKKAREVPAGVLDSELGSGYGIFAGAETRSARLRFSPHRARWVANEQWHSKQRGYYDEHGYYVLEFPYSDERELMMDILKFGPDVEVVAPDNLREAVASAAEQTMNLYRNG